MVRKSTSRASIVVVPFQHHKREKTVLSSSPKNEPEVKSGCFFYANTPIHRGSFSFLNRLVLLQQRKLKLSNTIDTMEGCSSKSKEAAVEITPASVRLPGFV